MAGDDDERGGSDDDERGGSDDDGERASSAPDRGRREELRGGDEAVRRLSNLHQLKKAYDLNR